jgi:DNA ligase-1
VFAARFCLLTDRTQKYPDLLQMMPTLADDTVQSFIIDSEVVAYDFTADKILPFQTLTTRARKVQPLVRRVLCWC